MILAPLLAALLAPAQPAETPRAFLTRVYAGYEHGQPNLLAHPERLFTPQLVRAIREDARLAKGEVGALDYDPLCQCQDADGMRPRVTEILAGKDAAVATVMAGRTGTSERRPFTLRLVRTPAGWRIGDVSTREEPSLVATLERANAERQPRRR